MALLGFLLVTGWVVEARAQSFLWAEQIGGTGWDEPGGIAVDSAGDIYVTGSFLGQATVGSGNTLNSAGSRGLSDIFLVKIDPSGAVLWAQSGGGPNSDRAHGVAVDGAGNVVVLGTFEGSTSFGNHHLGSAGSNDVFVVKYDSAGSPLWAKSAGGPKSDMAHGIAVDAADNIVVTGHFRDEISFGTITLNANRPEETFVAKYDSNGSVQWAERAGGSYKARGGDVAVHSSGLVYVTGSFDGQGTFGTKTVQSNGLLDIFVAKYDADGNFQWVERSGGPGFDEGRGIAVDHTGSAFVTGLFAGQASFDNRTVSSSGSQDFFWAEYDSSGNLQQVVDTGGTSSRDRGLGIALDGSGNVVTTGEFDDLVGFGSIALQSGGGDDIFVFEDDANGTNRWAKRAGGSGSDEGTAIAVDGAGDVYVIGGFEGGASFGSHNLTSTGSKDIFVAKIGSSNGPGLGVLDICTRYPNLCVDVGYEPGIVEIPCNGRVPCYGVDPVPYNCKVKYGCPGCGGGVGLCPPYYHLFFDGLDPEVWRVELATGGGEPVPHEVVATEAGAVLSFRPSEERFEPEVIGDYVIVFGLEEAADPQETYRFGARIERASEPFDGTTDGDGRTEDGEVEAARVVCVTFDNQPAGQQYGAPAGHSPGTRIFTQNGIDVRVADFRFTGTGGTFNFARIEPSTARFGVGTQYLAINNLNLVLDFAGLSFTPSRVTFELLDLGGFENLAINGAPTPAYAGELTAAPSPIGGVNFTTGAQTSVTGGYRSDGTLAGQVSEMVVGGQEFGIDEICAHP